MGTSGRWLCTALLIGCGSKGPTDRPAHSPPNPPDATGTTSPAPTPEELIEQLEDQGAIPKLDRTQTLGGLDDNVDGIRDDIEKHIDAHYWKLRNPARQLAAALQASLLVDRADPVALGEVALQIARAVDCLDRSGFKIKNKPDDPDVLDALQAITANTKLRMIAYLRFNQALDGTLTFPLEGEVVCD